MHSRFPELDLNHIKPTTCAFNFVQLVYFQWRVRARRGCAWEKAAIQESGE